MDNQFTRTEMLLGKDNMEIIKKSHVAVFGVGGVGSFTAESLARCGIGELTLIDHDIIDVTNINRQIHANHNTIGKQKTEVMKNRILEINPNVVVNVNNVFVLPDNINDVIDNYSFIVDAVDKVTAKLCIIEKANEKGIPVISSMGTGNKLHPEMLKLADIYKTNVCPLAKVMRKELKKRNVSKLQVCYSEENPVRDDTENARTPASISFVPSVAGLIIAGYVVRTILKLS